MLQRFAQDDRVKIPRPEQDLQVKMVRSLPGDNEFVAYIDALGELDGAQCLIDWKTTTSRYSEEPEGLVVTRSPDDLLFLDQRNSGCRGRRLRSKKRT